MNNNIEYPNIYKSTIDGVEFFTAFLIKKEGYLLTVAHPFWGLSDKEVSVVCENEQKHKLTAKPIFVSREKDIDFALLKTVTNNLPKPLELFNKTIEENDEIYGYGYGKANIGNKQRFPLDKFDGTVGKNYTFSPKNERQIVPGDSGAPVFDYFTKKVVGINHQRSIKEYDEDIFYKGYILPLKNIFAHLEKESFHKIKFENLCDKELKVKPLTKPREVDRTKVIFRKTYINQISECFKNNNIVNLFGNRGLGKTTIAECYYLRALNEYNYVGWFDFNESISLTFANKYRNTEFNEKNPKKKTEFIASDIAKLNNKLIVINNVTNAQDIIENIDLLNATGSNILITSQNMIEHSKIKEIKIHQLSDDEAIEMLKFQSTEVRSFASKVLLNNPLAIKLYLANINKRNIKEVSNFNEEYIKKESVKNDVLRYFIQYILKKYISDEEQWVLMQLSVLFNEQYNVKDIINFLELEETNGEFKDTQAFTSFKQAENSGEKILSTNINTILDTLSNKKILDITKDCFVSLNPIIAEIVLGIFPREPVYFFELLDSIYVNYFGDEYGPIKGASLFIAHAEKTLDIFEEYIQNENILSIYEKLIRTYGETLLYKKELGERIYYTKLIEEITNKNDLRRAIVYNELYICFKKNGHYDKALEYCIKEIKIKEEVLKKSDPRLAICYNNISVIYRLISKYEEAYKFIKIAIKIQENVLENNHPSLAISYSNISEVYRCFKKYDKAFNYIKKAIKIQEEELEKKDPHLAISYDTIARASNYLKKHIEALEYNEKAIKIQEEVLDKNHPHLANSYHNIAGTYFCLIKYDKALKYFEKAIKIKKEVLGNNHPDLVNSYRNIAKTYYTIEDYKHAKVYFDKAVGIMSEIYSNDDEELLEAIELLKEIDEKF